MTVELNELTSVGVVGVSGGLDLAGLPPGTEVFVRFPQNVTLELTMGEAIVLNTLLRHIGGCPSRTARGNLEDIAEKLRKENVGLHPGSEMDPHDPHAFVDIRGSGGGNLYLSGKKL